jgi:hypothetical protein
LHTSLTSDTVCVDIIELRLVADVHFVVVVAGRGVELTAANFKDKLASSLKGIGLVELFNLSVSFEASFDSFV